MLTDDHIIGQIVRDGHCGRLVEVTVEEFMGQAYKMEFVRTQPGIRVDCDRWDFGLADFGFGACEQPAPIELAAADLESARAEAAHHWAAWRSGTDDDAPIGYWIRNSAGRIVEAHADHESRG